MKYGGKYPYYTIWKDGVEDTRFACNTLEQAQALILDLRGAAFAKVQMAEYAIIGSYPRYAITRDGCLVNQYLCNTEGEAKQLMAELQAQEEQDNGS